METVNTALQLCSMIESLTIWHGGILLNQSSTNREHC